MAKASWGTRFGWIALVMGGGGTLLAFLAATAVRYAEDDKLAMFGLLPMGAALALAGLMVGVIALIVGKLSKAETNFKPTLIGIGSAAVLLGLLASAIIPGRAFPMLHDVTTDPADPPAFQTLSLRKDNLAGVETIENWREIHVRAFPDIQPVVIAASIPETIARAEKLAQARRWEIAAADPAGGRIEATATVSYFRFKDDVVLRATPAANGGSRVDMRSVSRVGVGDLGENAKRVRAFLADLQAAG